MRRSLLQSTPGRSDSKRGFTLIELILGIGIMASVLIAINAVFFSTLRLREATHRAVESSLPVQQTLATIRRDLQGAMAPSSNGVLAGAFKAGEVTSAGNSQPVRLEFNTSTGVLRDEEPWGDVQRVAYGLRFTGSQNRPGNELYRFVTRNLLATIPPQPEEQWMMDGVEDLEISCFDGIEWRDYWDTTLTDTNLPLAVRIRILLADADNAGDPRQLEMVVPLSAQSGTNQVEVTQ